MQPRLIFLNNKILMLLLSFDLHSRFQKLKFLNNLCKGMKLIDEYIHLWDMPHVFATFLV